MVYTESFGAAAFIARVRTVALRNTGAAISPFNAFMLLQGLETLGLRMERHCENALAVASFLQQHPKVTRVNYPGLSDNRYFALAQKYTQGRPSALLTFEIKGGLDEGIKLHDGLNLFKKLVNIGDAKSLVCHPASTTHRQLSADELQKAGVSPSLLLLSVGIEDKDDLIADLQQALDSL